MQKGCEAYLTTCHRITCFFFFFVFFFCLPKDKAARYETGHSLCVSRYKMHGILLTKSSVDVKIN